MTHDGNDTSHNDWDGTLHHEVRAQDSHGGDSYTRLGRSITDMSAYSSHVLKSSRRRGRWFHLRGTDTGEDDGGRAAHGAEEGGVDGTEIGGGRHDDRFGLVWGEERKCSEFEE